MAGHPKTLFWPSQPVLWASREPLSHEFEEKQRVGRSRLIASRRWGLFHKCRFFFLGTTVEVKNESQSRVRELLPSGLRPHLPFESLSCRGREAARVLPQGKRIHYLDRL